MKKKAVWMISGFALALVVGCLIGATPATRQTADKVAIASFKKCLEKSEYGQEQQKRFDERKKEMEKNLLAKEKELNEMAPKFKSENLETLTPQAEAELKEKFKKLSNEFSMLQSRYSQELNKLVKATGQQVKPSRQYLAAETPYKPAREVSLAQAGVRGLLPTVVVSVGLLIAAIIFTNQMVSEGLIKQSYSLGMEFYKGGQKELARKKFDDIVRARPKDGEGYFFRGLASAELNEYDLAIEDYDAAIKLQPGHVASYTGRALAYIKLRDFRRAIADCDAALKLKKDYVDAYRLKAIAEAKDGRFSQAVQDCDKFIALSPGKGLSEVLTVRGFAKFKLGKVRDAMENFEAAIKYAPKDGSVYANVAQCHYLLHDYAGTIALCDQALHWSPRHVGALILRGRCRAQSADYKKALADFNKAVTVDPSPESYRSRADVYLSLKNYSAAAADLEEVIRLSPGDKAARSSLEQAWVHVKQAPSRTTPFVESQAKAIVAVTGSSDDLIRRGYQLLRSGSNGEAVVVLSAAVKADPQSVLARRYLAHALAQSGSVGGAVQQFQVLSGLGALEAADQLAYGKVLVSGRKFAQAIQIYSRLLSSDPGNSAARKGLIQAYIASGAQTEAVSACNEGLRNARSPQELSVYQGLLKSAQRGKAGSGEDKAH